MKYIKINRNNIEYLKIFLDNMGNSKKYFRYYEKRNFDVIENHIYTIIGLDEFQNPISYGHLDIENNVVWLGICVKEKETGKGLGKAIIKELINYAVKINIRKIRLSVDNLNKAAINLYLKMNFKLDKKEKKHSYYILEL